MIKGAVSVQSGVEHFALFHEVEQMPSKELAKVNDGYLWFDWFSIPQITARVGGAARREFPIDVGSESAGG